MNIKSQNQKYRKKNADTREKMYVLCKELEQYEEAGISLWLNGRLSDPNSIASACIMKEENLYMRDYYSNDKDEICGIGFNKI